MLNVILTAILPRHIKRLLFCGSVYAQVATKYKIAPTTARLIRLNKLLKLAHRSLSIECPCSWAKIMWKELPEPPFDNKKIETFAVVVLKYTPSYLMYSRELDMADDVTKILRFIVEDKDFAIPKCDDLAASC